MAQSVRVNKEVVLQGGDNNFLQYPVRGVIETAEYAVDGSMIWCTFLKNDSLCPVFVRSPKLDQ